MNKAEDDLVKFVVAFLIPPLAAYWKVGLTQHFYINVVLTLLFFVPGMFHALWLVLPKKSIKKPVRQRSGQTPTQRKRRAKKGR
jgi:uncharacterized membrane protein YqaE (UPF0057 family)